MSSRLCVASVESILRSNNQLNRIGAVMALQRSAGVLPSSSLDSTSTSTSTFETTPTPSFTDNIINKTTTATNSSTAVPKTAHDVSCNDTLCTTNATNSAEDLYHPKIDLSGTVIFLSS